jgi:hypothetical protein
MMHVAKTTRRLCVLALVFTLLLAATAPAGPPVPLESAYWRFEEGPASSEVPANVDVVLDSINDNPMRGFENATVDATPTYVTTVPPTPLKSGLPNTLALDFIRNPEGGGDDLFALEQAINNGTIAPGGGFTVEAAFRSNNPALFAGIVGKEGQPGGSRPVQTFALKTRADNSLLQVEQWDANANLVQVSSLEPIVAGQWYYAAVVNNGSTLSLYLDSNDGSGYELQGSVAVNGALYQANPANPNWDGNWTIGRGEFGGFPADWFDGIIDEVRLTNAPLAPSEFLFASAVAPLEGDYNEDGKVDAADYVVWRKTGINGQQGYDTWRANFGRMAMPPGSGATVAVPEPATVLFCLLAACVVAVSRWRHRLQPQLVVLPMERKRMKTSERPRRISYCLLAFAVALSSRAMGDTAPNPLESAYWRFEEGSNATNVNAAAADPVPDLINQNHMDVFNADTAPVYINNVPPTPLKSGLPNTLALDFIPHAGGGDDLFTLFSDGDFGKGSSKNINNGIVAPGGGFTIEAAFNTNNPVRWAAVVGKDARPGGTNHPVQTAVLKTRGDNGHLFFEQWDAESNLVGIDSISPINAGQWYYAAAVNDGSTLSLYLNSNDGLGYQLQGSVAVDGALFQGNPANPLWDASWTIGRGQFGGNPTDWFDGIIDEVRITNSALAPSEFLFAPAGLGAVVPEPSSFALLSVAALCVGRRRHVARRRVSPRLA